MMDIVWMIAAALLTAAAGYGFILTEAKEKNPGDRSQWKLDARWKLLYWGSCLAVSIALIVVFSGIYQFYFVTHKLRMTILALLLISLAFIDYEKTIVPNRALLCAAVLRAVILIAELLASPSGAWRMVIDIGIGVLVLGGFFFALTLFFPSSIGMGDIKLFVIMALYQGLWGSLSSVFMGLIVTFFYAVWLLIRKKKSKKDAIPLVPTLAIGVIASIVLSGM